MSGHFGTARQMELQARAEAALPWIAETPGACNAARIRATDDPDTMGWDSIERILAEDGIIGFRLVPRTVLEKIGQRLADIGYRLDQWNVFVAARDAALARTAMLLSSGLPAGFSRSELAEAGTTRVQEFMARNGIAPFPEKALSGRDGPASTVVIVRQATGEIAATAHCYMPHNRHSPHRWTAWGGLVAVDPAIRGAGLGKLANAMMVREAFEKLPAEKIYELVAETNVASRRMVEACGLSLQPEIAAAMAVAAGNERFSR
jgi:hypothetical protein